MRTVLVPLAAGPRPSSDFAPLRRSLPAPEAPSAIRSKLKTALLTLTGIVVFVDIEFALAYALYFAIRLVG